MPKILLVEDDALLSFVLREELTDFGYGVVAFPSADCAIDHLQTAASYDVLLTDVNLPGEMDGAALAAWAAENRPEMLTLVMSGRYPAKGELGGLSDTVTFFPKPFYAADVDAHIRAARPQLHLNSR